MCLGSGILGCSTPTVAPGFYIRSDLPTTDCEGTPQPQNISADPDVPKPDEPKPDVPKPNPWGFLYVQQPSSNLRVADCSNPGQTLHRTGGLPLNPGDVLSLATGIVGPQFNGPGDVAAAVVFPATVTGLNSVALRRVDTERGRLYPPEEQLLAAAFMMTGLPDGAKRPPAALAAALDRRGPLIWNAFIEHVRIQRMASNWPNASQRPALKIEIRPGEWCRSIQARMDEIVQSGAPAATEDRRAIVSHFGPGNPPACPDPTINREFSNTTSIATGPLHATAMPAAAGGPFPASKSGVALYTLFGVTLKGVRISDGHTSSRYWTLADWESAGICRNAQGRALSIDAVTLRDGTSINVTTTRPPTFAVRVVFTQSRQGREIVPLLEWHERWRREISHSDLDKLYGEDIRSITWNETPSEPSMCLASGA